MPNAPGKFANSINGIIQRVTYELNDSEIGWENQAWSEDWIRARVFDAFKWFQKDDPTLFSEERTVDLKPGHRQVKPKDCDALLSVEYVINDKGEEIPVLESDYDALKSASVYDKLQGQCDFPICSYQYAMHSRSKDSFYFNPAIPGGSCFKYVIMCSNAKAYLEDADKEIDCEFAQFIPAVVEWVLYQAKIMDGLSPELLQAARVHRDTFFALAPQLRRLVAQGEENAG